MAARTIHEDTSLETQAEEIAVTEARLRIHPLTTAFADEFATLLQSEWQNLQSQRWSLFFDLLRAEAKVWFADTQLDRFVDKFHPTLMRAVNNDTTDVRYRSLMKGKRPFELKRPALRGQLAIMKEWPKTLEEKAYAGLEDVLAMRPELIQLLAAATDAENELELAKKQSQNFRTIGERRAFTDKHNALRQATSGKLAEMVHSLASAGLPSDFPDWFFLKSTRNEERDPTPEEIDQEIKTKEAEIVALRARYEEAKQKQAAAEEKEREREEKEAKLAAAKQKIKEAEAEAASLEAALKKR